MADVRHFDKSKNAISVQRFDRSPQNFARWCTVVLWLYSQFKNWLLKKTEWRRPPFWKKTLNHCTQQHFTKLQWRTLALLSLRMIKDFLKTMMADGRCPDMSAVDMIKATQQHTQPIWCECRWGTCILAPPGEYDWTVPLRRQCGLLSNYSDHLLLLLLLLLMLFCCCIKTKDRERDIVYRRRWNID